MRNSLVSFAMGALFASAMFFLFRGPEDAGERPFDSMIESGDEGLSEVGRDTAGSPESAASQAAREMPPASPGVPAATPVGVAPSDAASVVREPASSPPSTMQPMDLFLQQRAVQANEAWSNEPRDPAWAPMATTEFSNYVSGIPALLRNGFPEIDCRSTSCKIEVTAYGAEALSVEEWFVMLREGIDDYAWTNRWSVMGFQTSQSDGATTATWFFEPSGDYVRGGYQFVIPMGDLPQNPPSRQ